MVAWRGVRHRVGVSGEIGASGRREHLVTQVVPAESGPASAVYTESSFENTG
jgi:hypothetical protein